MKQKIDGIKFRSKVYTGSRYDCEDCIARGNKSLCNNLGSYSNCSLKGKPVFWKLPKPKKGVIYVTTDYKDCDYITPGKIYKAYIINDKICRNKLVNDIFYKIKDKDNFEINIKIFYCAHLNGNNWKVLK